MSSNDIKTNLKDHKKFHHKQTGKHSLLLIFYLFISWAIVVGLLISLLANLPNSSKTFVIFITSEVVK